MDDALLVGVLQAARELAGYAVHLVQGQGAPRQAHAQVLALGQFHDQDRLTVHVFETVKGGDVLVLQRGQHAGFALEPGQAVGLAGQLLRQHLQRHIAVQTRVPRLVDLAHAPATDGRRDFIDSDFATQHACPPW